MADRGVAGRRSERKIDRHTRCGIDVGNPGVAVAGDDVIATQPLELVERRAGIDGTGATCIGKCDGRYCRKSGGIVSI